MNLIPHPAGGWIDTNDPGEPIYNTPRISIASDEMEALAQLVEGKTVLEIGTGLGISTRAMAMLAEHVYTCDVDVWVWDNVFPSLRQLPNVTTIKLAPFVAHVGIPQVDAVFIDGCHSDDAVQADAMRARLYLKPHGTLIFHDYKMASVRGAVKTLGGHLDEYPTTYGLGVVTL